MLLVGSLLAVALLTLGWRLTGDVNAKDGDREPGTPRDPHLIATDSSGNGNHGVIQGSPTLGLRGHSGTAYSFDDRGSWVSVPSTASLRPGNGDFLFAAWVNFKVAPTPGETFDIVRKGLADSFSGEFKVEIIPGGHVKCSAKDADAVEASISGPDTNLADGRWHRIGCARTGPRWSVIVDGTVSSKAGGLGAIGNSSPLSIGSKYGLEDLPRGRVDEVVMYISDASRPRTKPRAAIRKLEAGTPVGLWHLDETA